MMGSDRKISWTLLLEWQSGYASWLQRYECPPDCVQVEEAVDQALSEFTNSERLFNAGTRLKRVSAVRTAELQDVKVQRRPVPTYERAQR